MVSCIAYVHRIMSNPFAEWLASQPHGVMTRIFRASGVSWNTLQRARRGEKVGLARAIRISRATGNAVPVEALTDELIPEDHAAVA